MRNILDNLLLNVQSEYEKKALIILKNLLTLFEKCYKCVDKFSTIILFFLMKLCLEIAFQLKYFKDKFSNKSVEEFIKDLYRRSRRGSSFSIRMLTDSKDIPGKFKKDFLKIYLKICEYVHPSYSIIFSNIDKNIVEELFRDFLDTLLYILLACYGRRDDLCNICLEYSLYHCSRRCK
ncbi:MAG: hypothetical protein GXO26_05975 [Crenarchaeota archaeon]|nr:hypothetical protein [Thermoproteota archaeon]